MMKKVEEIEEIRNDQIKQITDKLAKKSVFARIFEFNRPRFLVFIGFFVSVIQGALMPIFGGVMAKMLFVLLNVFQLDKMRELSNRWCGIMFAMALCAFLTGFLQKLSFGIVGENVTLSIRLKLYLKMLEKNMGWFDDRENSPSILTSILSTDAQIINGASTVGLSAILDAGCAVLAGLAIGLGYSWKMVLVSLAITPFTVLMGFMIAMF